MYPYGDAIIDVGFIVFGILTLLSGMCIFLVPNSSVLFLFMFCDGSLLVITLFITVRKTSHSWFSFDSIGVHKHYLLGGGTSFPWNECTEIGIALRKEDVSCVPWLYFSKKPLSIDQVWNVNRIKLRDNDFIMLYFREPLLHELGKYLDVDKVKNLQLIDVARKKN